jgi:hypothetical protein
MNCQKIEDFVNKLIKHVAKNGKIDQWPELEKNYVRYSRLKLAIIKIIRANPDIKIILKNIINVTYHILTIMSYISLIMSDEMYEDVFLQIGKQFLYFRISNPSALGCILKISELKFTIPEKELTASSSSSQ